MNKQELYAKCSAWFAVAYPKAESELHFSSPYELLVAVILSAQCTDKRVNMVTPTLFEAFPTVEDLASVTAAELLPYIRSISYPNAKSEHLIGMARKVVSDYGGIIPHTMDELTSLPGVGRKTANVMIAVAFGGQAMPVDTHVFRVSHRIGLVTERCKTPWDVERELSKHFNHEQLSTAHHWLILHGRYCCTARAPKCDKCGLSYLCSYYKSAHKPAVR